MIVDYSQPLEHMVHLNWVLIGSDNAVFSSVWCQAITATNGDLFSIDPIVHRNTFDEIWIKIQKLFFNKLHPNMSSAKRFPFAILFGPLWIVC